MEFLFSLPGRYLGSTRQRFAYLPKALGLVWAAAKGWAVLWLGLLVVKGVLPAANVYLTKVLVDRISIVMEAGFSWSSVEWVLLPAGLIAGLLILEQILGGLIGWVRSLQSEYLVDHVQFLIHEKASRVELAFYDSAAYYDHLDRANSGASGHILSILQNSGAIVQDTVTMLSIAGLLLMYGFWVPLALIASALPALWVVVQHSKRVHDWWAESTVKRRWASYYDSVLTSRAAAPEIRIFNLANYFRTAYVELRHYLRDTKLRLMRNQALATATAGIFGLTVVAGSLGWMLWRAFHGLATLGDLALFYQAFNRGQAIMRALLNSLGTLYSDSLFLEHLFTFLDLEPRVTSPAHPLPVPNPPQHEIAFRDVTFRYPGNDKAVLERFNLVIPVGRTIAIVGPNGAGKSTLINLMCRFYDPSGGRVEIDGIDVRELDLLELRSLITVMFQYPVRWIATAKENIIFGNLQEEYDQASVEAAAKAGGAASIIDGLPYQYDTLLGKQFDEGAELSGGEWQRISLARAFYRKAPLVILDEPTSSMDSWEEAKWLNRFRKLVKERTAIIVTHRFTTAMRADIIYVMEEGEIIESGSHAELLILNGRYAESWSEQVQSHESALGRVDD